MSSPDDIIYYAKLGLGVSEQIDDPELQGAALFLLGDGYKLKGDLIKATTFYFRGIKFFERINAVDRIAVGLINIGGIQTVQENYSNSVKYYYRAISILEDNKDTFKLAAVYNNLGDSFRLWSEFDSALINFKKARQLFSDLNSDIGIAYSLGNIGLVYAAMNKNDSAEYYINQATKILEELGDRYPIAVYQTYMADIYKDKGDEEKALEYAHNSLNIAKEEGLKEQIRDASLKLSELYSEFGDFEKAYDYQDQYLTYRDSINNEDVIRKMADLRAEYEVSKKQTEINLLDARNKNQTIINYTLAGGVLMLLILGHLFYQNSRKSKQVNHILYEQNEEIETQRDKLEELVDMKNRFFGIISHDLRSPVNSLQGISQLLQYAIKNKQEKEIEQFVGLADQSINNLASLLDNLLSWALSQQGSLPYNPEKFKFYYVAREVKNIFQNAALAKQIEINVTVSEDVEIYADRDGIFALTRNLVNNALKFTGNGGKIDIIAKRSGLVSKIHITDSGMGIPEEKLQNLFVFDKKKSTKGTAGEKGSGLGLALCHDIVQLNAGEITVESKFREGSTFTVILPADKSSAKP